MSRRLLVVLPVGLDHAPGHHLACAAVRTDKISGHPTQKFMRRIATPEPEGVDIPRAGTTHALDSQCMLGTEIANANLVGRSKKDITDHTGTIREHFADRNALRHRTPKYPPRKTERQTDMLENLIPALLLVVCTDGFQCNLDRARFRTYLQQPSFEACLETLKAMPIQPNTTGNQQGNFITVATCAMVSPEAITKD